MTTPTHPTALVHRIVPSPLGPITLVAAAGAVTGLYLHHQNHHPSPDDAPGAAAESADRAVLDRAVLDRAVLDRAERQLIAYFSGELTTFDLPLAPRGTPFQVQVWRLLQGIEFGRTTTYGAIAAALGRPDASRAVGAAVGRNPIGVIVPCHRVIGASGALTGYAGGIERKVWLLDHEGAFVGSAAQGTLPI